MTYLYHHGILGQRWGKKNGPPYPLDPEDHSKSEKNAGWRKSLDGGSGKNDKSSKNSKGSSQEARRKRRKILITTAVAALAIYGGYRYVKYVKENRASAASLFDEAMGKIGDNPVSSLFSKTTEGGDFTPKIGIVRHIKEPLLASLHRANPLGKDDNCTACSISGILRMSGLNATAKDCGLQSLSKIVDEVFGYKIAKEAMASTFAKSPEEAKAMLVRWFGKNASGVCGVRWKNGTPKCPGHAFSWTIKNGVVTFLDFQSGEQGASLNRFWENIDPAAVLELARLDNVLDKINYGELMKYVDFK